MVATLIILFATTTQASALNWTGADESPGYYLTDTVQVSEEATVTKETEVTNTLQWDERVTPNGLGQVTLLTRSNVESVTHALSNRRTGGENPATWWEEPGIRNTIAAARTGPFRRAQLNRTATPG
jgi:hypothetical protein